MDKDYDVIIIGKGPGGISVALYTARAGLSTLIIGKEDSLLKKAPKIDNYYGFADTISGSFLLEQGEKQALRLGASIISEEIVSIDYTSIFEVVTSSEKVYKSPVILLATGRVQDKLAIQNISKFEGKGVSYCAVCDGFFYKNRKIGLIGFKDYVVHEALELKTYTNDITIFTNGMPLVLSDKFNHRIEEFKINTSVIQAIEGQDKVECLLFKDGSKEELDGVFIAYGSASSVNFAKKLGIVMEDGYIVVDKNQQTNIPGVFAVGDCTNGAKQISIAVGQGALAGIHIINYSKNI